MRGVKILIFIVILILFIGSVSVAKVDTIDSVNKNIPNSDFYFIQLTDTHIRNRFVDILGSTINRLKTVLKKINSFEKLPAFIVITGDLCEWAGSDSLGALNCKAFLSCFYVEDDQIYADSNLKIPVYTTPGNHDYVLSRNLKNYHKYIDKNHIEDEDRYVVTYGDVSLFFMDSGPNYYSDPKIIFEWHGEGLYENEIEWLDEELNNCESAKKIVLMHHPAVGVEEDLFINNRKAFVDLCESYDVELVLAGHTHSSRVFDIEENLITNLPLNCNDYPTLYVQTDACKQGIHYRNISITFDGIVLENTQEVEYISMIKPRPIQQSITSKIVDISKDRLIDIFKYI